MPPFTSSRTQAHPWPLKVGPKLAHLLATLGYGSPSPDGPITLSPTTPTMIYGLRLWRCSHTDPLRSPLASGDSGPVSRVISSAHDGAAAEEESAGLLLL